MGVRPGYKYTEVGVIPEDWDVRPLLTTVRIANGQVDPRVEPYRAMTLVAPDHIESGTGRLLSRQTASDQRAISGKYLFGRGDIVYSKIRPYLRKAVLAEFDGLCSADMYPLKPAADVAGGFMLGILLGHRFTKYAESVSVRSGMPKINRAELADFVVALPSALEQRAIATALCDVDALLIGLDRLIAKKRDLKQATMQQLLTGRTRLPGFHCKWEVKRLGEITTLIPGGVYGEEKPRDTLIASRVATTAHIEMDDTWNNKGMNVRYFSRDQIKCYSPIEGDLIVVKSSGSAASIQSGKIGFVNENKVGQFVFSNFLMLLRPAGIFPRFLYFYLCSNNVKKLLPALVEASTYPNIRIHEYLSVEIPVPPLLEQTAIAAVLSDMDAELSGLEARRDKIRALKQAMMQELLTGKTRLVPAGAAHA